VKRGIFSLLLLICKPLRLYDAVDLETEILSQIEKKVAQVTVNREFLWYL
jgi:hypothetical protein